MANILIEINNLYKSFEKHQVLSNVSLNVVSGENLVVFGRSGTGKSVLLKCIVGLMKPEKGEIKVLGKNVLKAKLKDINELRKKMGFLFQSAALYDSMTVSENLRFPLIRNFDFTENEIQQKVKVALKRVSLEDAFDKMPSELSGGMRKRIGLARSIITEPEIMFYDEPTTGLDPITSKEISELILELQKTLNMTSIVVTHDLICARIIADRAIFLKNGEVAYKGTIDELTKSEDQFLKDFFGYISIME